MTATAPCLHVLVASSKLCSRCHATVPSRARLAARLRGRYGCVESSLPTVVQQGVSTHIVVRGDDVGEVVINVRPRRKLPIAGTYGSVVDAPILPPDPAHITTDLVAEVLQGCDAVGLPSGLVVEVKTHGVVVAEAKQ